MEDFLIYLLKSAGLLTAFLLCYYLLLKKETTFITNRRFLLGGIITSVILPAIYFTKKVVINVQPSQFQLNEAIYPLSTTEVPEQSISILEILAGIYILGVLVMVIRLLFQLLSLTRILFSGKISAKNGRNFIETSRKIPPFSFLNYIVYNPDSHSNNELDYILKHEKVHVKQWHTLDVLVANFNLIYQWFNPFAWMYLKSIQQNLEFIADSEVVKKAACKKEYQKTLVRISVENFNLSLTNNFYQSLIKKRIVMLNKSSSVKATSWKAALIAPALFAFIFIFNIKTVAQVITVEKENENQVEEVTDFELSFKIPNTTKQEQLDRYSKKLQKYKVQLDFENVTRNNDGIITGITANFLDKNNNSSGSISQQKNEGVEGFGFYYNEKKGSGFSKLSNNLKGGFHKILTGIQENPLFIIGGKKYTTPQLEGKTIRIEGEVSSLAAHAAVEAYGDDAKNGAIVVSKGTVIDDFKAELKKINLKSGKAIKEYIQIEKGQMPTLISLNKKDKAKVKVTSDSKAQLKIKNLKTSGKNPIYVLNGKILGSRDDVDTLNVESIKGVSVLKGYSAKTIFGNKAKDGAVIITTKKQSDTADYSYSFVADTLVFMNASQNSYRKQNSPNAIESYTLTPNQNSVYIISRDSTNAPLYVIDGKEMKIDFKINNLNHKDFEQITVLKDAAAIEKYGKKAKGGVIEITTKNKQVIDIGSMIIITASSSSANLKEFEARLKDAGITGDFEKIKRNEQGLITSIKITARHKGSEMSATFSETEGIPNIYVGLIKGKLVVSSNPPGMN